MVTFSGLYNEVLHKEESPRHLYILLEAWLEMNKLIFAWQVAELKYVYNSCQKNAQSLLVIQVVKKKIVYCTLLMHVSVGVWPL